MQNKTAYVDTFFKNAITCNNDNNDNNDNNLHASALIQEDPDLISIDGSTHIKIAPISSQGWKIETREQEIMKLIEKPCKFVGQDWKDGVIAQLSSIAVLNLPVIKSIESLMQASTAHKRVHYVAQDLYKTGI